MNKNRSEKWFCAFLWYNIYVIIKHIIKYSMLKMQDCWKCLGTQQESLTKAWQVYSEVDSLSGVFNTVHMSELSPCWKKIFASEVAAWAFHFAFPVGGIVHTADGKWCVLCRETETSLAACYPSRVSHSMLTFFSQSVSSRFAFCTHWVAFSICLLSAQPHCVNGPRSQINK